MPNSPKLQYAFALSAYLLVIALLPYSGASHAQSPRDVLATMLASPDTLPEAIERGRSASFFCANCHGAAGISKYPEVPNLAAQHPVYLLNQIEAFADGRRRDEFMEGLVKVLSPQEKAAIALFYSRQPAQAGVASDAAAASPGGELYRKVCAGCHGAKAAGQEIFPRLAGQKPEYLRRSLRRYLERSGERNFAPMSEAVEELGAERIDAVVNFLSGLD